MIMANSTPCPLPDHTSIVHVRVRAKSIIVAGKIETEFESFTPKARLN